jgi:hypothetical protein
MKLSVECIEYSYEQVLGSLGAQVDQHDCNRVRIAERPDGFEVEYRAGDDVLERVHVEFDKLSAGSTTSNQSSARRPDRYRDFLAAIGRELDGVSAENVVIEYADQVTIVSYWYRHPTADFVSQHREFALGPEARHMMLLAEQTQQLSIMR